MLTRRPFFNSTAIYLLGFCALMALVVVVAKVAGFFPDSAPETASLTGKEIARKSSPFIESFNADDSATRFALKTCQGERDCFIDQTIDASPDAGRTWRMVANASLYKLTGENRYKDLVVQDIEYLKNNGFGDNLHLAYLYLDVNKLVPSAVLLDNGYSTARAINAQLNLAWKDDQIIRKKDVMAVAAMTKLLANAHEALKSEANQKIFFEDLKIAERKEQLDDDAGKFINGARRLSSLVEKISAATETPLTNSQGYKFNSQTCWSIFAKAAVFKETKDPELLRSIRSAVIALRLWSAEKSEVPIASSQAVLACVTAMKDLQSEGVEFAESFYQLVTHYLLEGWDSPLASVCTGDGGFMSPLATSVSCVGRSKYLSDNAWVIALLSDVDTQFPVRQRG